MDLDWLGYMAAVLTTASFVPQALKTIRTRDTHSISTAMYAIFTTGVLLWLAYGVAIDSWPIVLSNALTALLAGTVLALKLRYG
jgi:MtN3 and saliva related transmembrane protein